MAKDNDVRKHDSNPDPITGEPGAHPLGVAGGGTGGAMAGAAIGGVVGGPIGAAVGGAIGAVAGGLAGKGVAESVNPTEEEGYWRTNYKNRPYFQQDREFDHYAPAYRYGWESAAKPDYSGRRFDEVERDLGANWNRARGSSKAEWNDMKMAARDAYERVQTRMTPGMTHASDKADAVWEQTKGNWHQMKGAIKAKWNDLTDDEIDQMKGERERIVGKIQEKYGEAKWREADIEREFRGFNR